MSFLCDMEESLRAKDSCMTLLRLESVKCVDTSLSSSVFKVFATEAVVLEEGPATSMEF
jgi:hypothetical protein